MGVDAGALVSAGGVCVWVYGWQVYGSGFMGGGQPIQENQMMVAYFGYHLRVG